MKPKKAIKELRKQLRDDPANVVLRIRLASLLRDVGQHPEAIEHYLSVAKSYDLSGRSGQALAVCKGVLEFAPQHEQARQIYAYLENQRQQADREDAASPLPPLPPGGVLGPDAPTVGDEGRRKRPTSMPTPLTDRGTGSLPGLRTTGAGHRSQRVSDSFVLGTRRPIPDNTVPGAPPKHDPSRVGDSQRITGSGFRLQDLNQAAQTPTPAGRADSESGIRTANRLPPAPPMRLPTPPSEAARSKKPAAPAIPDIEESRKARTLPLSPGKLPEAVVTKQFARTGPALSSARFDPPTLAPTLAPPTLAPPPTPTPPQASDEEDGPSLEDATIVDANFDLVAFMAEQEAKEEDLPDLPGTEPSPLDSVTLDVLSQSADASFSEIAKPAIALSALGALQGLPRYALDVLLDAATLQGYPDGAMVVSEGAPLGACRIIQSGQLQLLKRDPASGGATLTSCATVGPGALVGASAFMSQVAGGEKMALGAAVADGPLSVVEVPVHAIDGLRDRFPAARSTLELFYRERCSDLLMSTSPLFASLTEHDRAELVGMFEPVRASAGQDVIERGGNIGGFFLVLSGQVEVLRDNGHTFVLQPGGYVGDVGVLRGQPSAATVRASQSTELGRLDAHRFYDLIAKHPEVWGEVWRESSRDELAELHLVLGTAATL